MVFFARAKDEDVSPELYGHGYNLVGWNGEKIVRAIYEILFIYHT